MLVEDVCTYLAATTSLGLTIRTTAGGNLYAVPIPETAPSGATCVIEYASLPPTRAMGADLSAPICETVRFQVLTRVASSDWSVGRALIEGAYLNLDSLHSTEIGSTGPTRYLSIDALGTPSWIGQDGSNRHKFACSFEARKERG